MSEQPEPNIHAKPVAPTVGSVFRTRVDRTDGKTAEHSAWIQDIEDRKACTAELEAKRRKLIEKASQPVDVLLEVDAALEALELRAQDFEASYGRPNEPLIAAKIEVARL